MTDNRDSETGRPGEGRLGVALAGSDLSERHRDILEAAATLFAERGYAATSVRDIGEKVGLLGGSLYHYIKSKEALFVRIHDMALQVAATPHRMCQAPSPRSQRAQRARSCSARRSTDLTE